MCNKHVREACTFHVKWVYTIFLNFRCLTGNECNELVLINRKAIKWMVKNQRYSWLACVGEGRSSPHFLQRWPHLILNRTVNLPHDVLYRPVPVQVVYIHVLCTVFIINTVLQVRWSRSCRRCRNLVSLCWYWLVHRNTSVCSRQGMLIPRINQIE